MKFNLEVTGDDSKEKLITFLETYGLQVSLVDTTEYGYSRTLQFTLHDQIYQIEWYTNESKLRVGTHKRGAFVMFKYIYFDTCMPIIGGNDNLVFTHSKTEKRNIFECEYKYSDFRLPL